MQTVPLKQTSQLDRPLSQAEPQAHPPATVDLLLPLPRSGVAADLSPLPTPQKSPNRSPHTPRSSPARSSHGNRLRRRREGDRGSRRVQRRVRQLRRHRPADPGEAAPRRRLPALLLPGPLRLPHTRRRRDRLPLHGQRHLRKYLISIFQPLFKKKNLLNFFLFDCWLNCTELTLGIDDGIGRLVNCLLFL